jgi:predicted lipoprotein with Yx(FWY)xxD motif
MPDNNLGRIAMKTHSRFAVCSSMIALSLGFASAAYAQDAAEEVAPQEEAQAASNDTIAYPPRQQYGCQPNRILER